MKSKTTKQSAEREIDVIKSRFLGMVAEGDKPSSSVSIDYSSKKVNLIDYGSYSEGRSGSSKYNVGTFPSGALGAKPLDHPKHNAVVWIIGGKLYVSDKNMESFEEIPTNIYGFAFGSDNTIKNWNEDVVIFATDRVFKLEMTGDLKRCYQINQDVPGFIPTDISTITPAPSALNDRKFNLWYTYVRLNTDNVPYKQFLGPGTKILEKNRYADGVTLDWETGTCNNGTEKDFAEIKEDYGMSANWIDGFKTPVVVNPVHATHYGIYKSKNISQDSDPPGYDPVTGVGNNGQLAVWCADIPIMKIFRATIIDDHIYLTIGSNYTYNYLSECDIGSIVYYKGGSAQITGIGLNVFDWSCNVLTGPETVSWTPMAIGIGAPNSTAGDYQEGSQNGFIITKTKGRNFYPSDVGRLIVWEDGRMSWVREYISTNTVKVDRDFNKADTYWGSSDGLIECFAMAQYTDETYNPSSIYYMSRSINDTWVDDGVVEWSPGDVQYGEYPQTGLQQKISSGKDFYYPRRYFKPIPCGEIGVIDGGYLITANRDGTEIKYSQISDRPHSIGYYREDIQKQEVEQNIRAIESINGIVSIFMKTKTKGMSLSVSTDVGNTDLGESVRKLQQAYMISENVGIISFGSIAYKGSNLIIAITNEFAVRYFDGTKWYEADLTEGFVKSLISKLDPYYPITATYSQEGGYKIWGKIWKPV